MYLGYGNRMNPEHLALALDAERFGVDSVWAGEGYGSDAATPLTWIAARTERIRLGTAVMQIPARTPAATAMTAATVNLLSDGRFVLGLGMSGPQVIEGWHGVPYGQPLARTREYVEIVREALRRQKPLEYQGVHYQIPFRGDGATGLGKPLKLIPRPTRDRIPVYLAALGPKSVALAAEVGDGWIPAFLSPERFSAVFAPGLAAGFARAADGRTRADFDIAPIVPVVIGDDLEACRDGVRPLLALYFGGMGAEGRNFYNDLACSYGSEEAMRTVQSHYLEGRRKEAAAAVPDGLIDEVTLVGPPARVADRLARYRDCGTTTLICWSKEADTLRVMAELVP
jgi:F420-dependent oxidoreductase-like protein